MIGGGDVSRSAVIPANLAGANLFGATLQGASLAGVDLKGANLYDAVLCNTLLDASMLGDALNVRYARAGAPPCPITGMRKEDLEVIENMHRQVESFFRAQSAEVLADEYHFWWNEARTERSTWLWSWSRTFLLKWTFGYGVRPFWILRFSFLLVLGFALSFAVLNHIGLPGSGVFAITESGEEVRQSRHLIAALPDSLYFSMLSLCTFGYGAFRPRQWLEWFRLQPVEFKPVGWARILVGVEAVFGIYLFALLAIVLLGRA